MSLYPPSTGIRVGRRWVGCSPGPHVVQLSCSEPSSEEHETRRRSPGRRPREKEPEMEAQAAPSAKRKVVTIALAALPLLFAIAGPAWRAVVAALVAALVAGAFNPAQPGRVGLLTVGPAVVVAAVRVSPNALSSPILFLSMLLIFPGVIAASGLVASYAGAGMARALQWGCKALNERRGRRRRRRAGYASSRGVATDGRRRSGARHPELAATGMGLGRRAPDRTLAVAVSPPLRTAHPLLKANGLLPTEQRMKGTGAGRREGVDGRADGAATTPGRRSSPGAPAGSLRVGRGQLVVTTT